MSDCGHCGKPVHLGGAVGATRLCHPDEDMDCYHLVTVYKHPMPCDCDGTLARVGMTPDESLRASIADLYRAIRQPNEVRHSLDDVARELGIDEDDAR